MIVMKFGGTSVGPISQGASRLNIDLVAAVRRAVESLHREFFTNPDPQVFAAPQVFK